jgi:hypothetical protein
MTLEHAKQPLKRTNQQNKALHKYCTELATELNNAGIGIDVFMKGIEADHTMESVKSLWRAFAHAKYGKTSTTELTTGEINAIFDEVNRHVSQWGIEMSFPSQELTDNYLSSYDSNN